MSRENIEKRILSFLFTPKLGRISLTRLMKGISNLSEFEDLSFLREYFKKNNALECFEKSLHPSFQKRAAEEWEFCQKNAIQILLLQDSDYPTLLKNIYEPPALLFYRGKKLNVQNYPLAFVGTRQASDYGKKVVDLFISSLREKPVTIVSGFAKGIDTFAHQVSLKNKIETLAVLGTGLDMIYPAENETLFYDMIQKGGLLTQFPSKTLPQAWNFPERNRLISGLSNSVLVVEAPEKSGALITAQFAIEEGREVWSIPNSIFSLKSSGANRLIQQGARIITSLEDFQEALHFQPSSEKRDEKKLNEEIEPVFTMLEEKQLWQCLQNDPLHIDKLTEISKLAPSLVSGLLMQMVLQGWVEEHSGKYFSRCFPTS